jgi:hypothetical protein
MNAIKSYPDFCGYGFVLFNRRMRFKELKVIPTFFVRKPVFISFLSKGRDNSKVGITLLIPNSG